MLRSAKAARLLLWRSLRRGYNIRKGCSGGSGDPATVVAGGLVDPRAGDGGGALRTRCTSSGARRNVDTASAADVSRGALPVAPLSSPLHRPWGGQSTHSPSGYPPPPSPHWGSADAPTVRASQSLPFLIPLDHTWSYLGDEANIIDSVGIFFLLVFSHVI